MNMTFVSDTPPLGHSLAITGAVRVDLGKPSRLRLLHDACKRVATALRPRRVCHIHPCEINLARQPRL